MRKLFTCLIILLLPDIVARPLLNMLGHKIIGKAKLGLCNLIWVDRLYLENHAKLGKMNYLNCRTLLMRESSYIGNLNIIRKDLSIILYKNAGIGTGNTIRRAIKPIVYGNASFKLGVWSKITSRHFIDCTSSIHIGDYTTLAGRGSQLWTHGYLHYPEGLSRIRIDGRILIGNNVYMGSGVIFSMGVSICSGVTIGAHSSVAKSITEPGLYVNQPLRKIDMDIDENLKKLRPVTQGKVCESVYMKDI